MLFSMLQSYFKMLFSKKAVWVAVLLFFVIALLNYEFLKSEEPVGNPLFIPFPAYHYFVSVQGGGSGFLFVFLPIFLAVVSGDLFIRERSSSYLMFSVMRMNIHKLIRNKIISIALISSLSIMLVQLLLYLYTLIMYPLSLPDPNQTLPFYAQDIYLNSPFVYGLIIIINSGFMGLFMGVLIVLFSLLFRNIYSAILAPFVFFIGVSEIMMLFPAFTDLGFGRLVYMFSPLVMSGDYITLDFSWWVIMLYWIILIIIFYLFTMMVSKKKYSTEKLI